MNQPHETQVCLRLRWVISLLLICIFASSFISFRLGKRQAYNEILEDCFSSYVSAALCFDAYQLHEKY